jgi:glutathione synthase/RimK-type ligase-like ATP-grasp enzyme
MMRKSLLIFFSGSSLNDPPFDDEEYRNSYVRFAEIVHESGAALYIARGQQTYEGANRFRSGWVWDNGIFKEHAGPIEAELIYNKGEIFEYDEHAIVVNDKEFDLLCRNKSLTIDTFSDLFPVTFTVRNEDEFHEALKKIPSDIAVMKPIDSWGGQGVFIGPKDDVIHAQKPAFPFIVQEFNDTSGGIPGIADGHHDFRLILFDDAVTIALLRIPKKGSFLSNIAQGGSMRFIPHEQIPEGALALFERINDVAKKYGKRIYSMDCGRNTNGLWKLFELNPQPGMILEKTIGTELRDAYLKKLASFLLH